MDRSPDLGRMGLIATLVIFVGLTYAGFAPPQQALFAAAADSTLTGSDPFLSAPGGFGPSLLFPLARLTGLGALPDLITYPLHLALSLALAWWAVAVIQRRLTGGNRTAAFLTVLIGLFFTDKLLPGVSLALVSTNSLTPAGLAQSLGLAALLAGLDRRPALAAIGATLSLACAPETGIPLAIASAFALALAPTRQAWAGVPLLAVGALLPSVLASAGPLPTPAPQPPLALAVSLATAGWAFQTGRHTADATIRAWLWGLSGGMVLAGLVALLPPALGRVLPGGIAPGSLLAITGPAGWLILTVAVAQAATPSAAGGLERLLRLGAVMSLAPTPGAVTAAAGLALFARFLRLLREKLAWRPGAGLAPVAILPPLLMVMILARSDHSLFGPGWIDSVAFAETGRWSDGVFADRASWRAWQELAALPDFPLVALYENRAFHDPTRARVALAGGLVLHPAANLAARKSGFLPPPGLLPQDPLLREEALRREAAIADLIRTLERGEPPSPLAIGPVQAGPNRPIVEIPQSIEAFLRQRRMGLLVSPGLARLFPPTLPRRQVGDQILLGFGIFP